MRHKIQLTNKSILVFFFISSLITKLTFEENNWSLEFILSLNNFQTTISDKNQEKESILFYFLIYPNLNFFFLST